MRCTVVNGAILCAFNECEWLINGLWQTSGVSRTECVNTGAAMIMEGSWFQAIIVRGKKGNL